MGDGDQGRSEEEGPYSRAQGDRVSYRHYFFGPQVLDRYRNDPRFKMETTAVGGWISIKDQYYLDPKTNESDKIGIQSFGFANGPDGSPAIAVPLRYLASLSAEHQDYWRSFELKVECKLDGAYVAQEFDAQFIEEVSIFQAFLQELVEINKICEMVGFPALFRHTYEPSKIPDFGWITKPTDSEYLRFVLLLDKLLSDNLSKDFFGGKLELTTRTEAKDGTVRVQDKGTLTLLGEFFAKYFRIKDPRDLNEAIDGLKGIRYERQNPAHKVDEDEYDEANFEKQRTMIVKAYKALRTIRLVLMNHPKAAGYKPPAWLQKGKIR